MKVVTQNKISQHSKKNSQKQSTRIKKETKYKENYRLQRRSRLGNARVRESETRTRREDLSVYFTKQLRWRSLERMSENVVSPRVRWRGRMERRKHSNICSLHWSCARVLERSVVISGSLISVRDGDLSSLASLAQRAVLRGRKNLHYSFVSRYEPTLIDRAAWVPWWRSKPLKIKIKKKKKNLSKFILKFYLNLSIFWQRFQSDESDWKKFQKKKTILKIK